MEPACSLGWQRGLVLTFLMESAVHFCIGICNCLLCNRHCYNWSPLCLAWKPACAPSNLPLDPQMSLCLWTWRHCCWRLSRRFPRCFKCCTAEMSPCWILEVRGFLGVQHEAILFSGSIDPHNCECNGSGDLATVGKGGGPNPSKTVVSKVSGNIVRVGGERWWWSRSDMAHGDPEAFSLT